MDGFESNVIASLQIGGSGIHGLVNWLGSMQIGGGVAGYNRSLNTVNASLSANYMNGLSGRYGYGTAYQEAAIYNSDGMYMEDGMIQPMKSYLSQYRIGEQYSVPDTDNSWRTYLSEGARDLMDSVFRENSMVLNDEMYGHQVYVDDNAIHRYSDSSSFNAVQVGDVNTLKFNVGYYDSPTDVRYGKRNVVDGGYVARESMERKFPGVSVDYGKVHAVVADKSRTSDAFGDIVDLFYGDGTSSAISMIDVADSKIESEDVLNNWYTVYKPYGVSPSEPYRYSVGDKVDVNAETEIDPSVKEGSLIKKTKTGSITYTYFEEGGNSEIGKTQLSDGTSVEISNQDSSSKLLAYTNKLFRDNKIKSIINRFHGNLLDVNDSDLVTSYTDEFGVSRGRNLLKRNTSSEGAPFDDPYCRVWTAAKQYSRVTDLIRPFTDTTVRDVQNSLGKDLRPNNGDQHLANYTVLDDNGFLRITPYRDTRSNITHDVRRYMFSIENLAWRDPGDRSNLSKEQIGPNGGRIMWFPPYGLTFTESTSVDWKKNNFIGRGESVFTYANTERVGNLEFILLIDHPSIVDKWRGEQGWGTRATDDMEQTILRYFAGCEQLQVKDAEPKQEEENVIPEIVSIEPEYVPDEQFVEINYVLFYPNNFSGKDYPVTENDALAAKLMEYEFTSDGAEFTESDRRYKDQILQQINKVNKSIYSLNTPSGLANNRQAIKDAIFGANWEGMMFSYGVLTNPANSENLETMLASGEDVFRFGGPWELHDITIQGFASSHGYTSFNNDLCRDRANTLSRMLKKYCPTISNDQIHIIDGREIDVKVAGKPEDINALNAKIARSAVAKVRFKLRDDFEPINITLDENNQIDVGVDLSTGQTENMTLSDVTNRREITISNTGSTPENGDSSEDYRASNEYLYFSRLKSESMMVYKALTDKVKYFDPAFHSMTPEGFNARLNFLEQCTRQGPTVGSHSGNETEMNADGSSNFIRQAANLAFGRPPYCVLRIGDFFNSKIVINSIQKSYDNSAGGITWDLNQEGAGVQPMYAKISISFTFIGGQDIGGPVAELQNAVSENYYANSSVYNGSTQVARVDGKAKMENYDGIAKMINYEKTSK